VVVPCVFKGLKTYYDYYSCRVVWFNKDSIERDVVDPSPMATVTPSWIGVVRMC
jgi:hypothetical protein